MEHTRYIAWRNGNLKPARNIEKKNAVRNVEENENGFCSWKLTCISERWNLIFFFFIVGVGGKVFWGWMENRAELRVLKRKKRVRVTWFHFTCDFTCTWNGCDFGLLGFTVRSEWNWTDARTVEGLASNGTTPSPGKRFLHVLMKINLVRKRKEKIK